MTKASFLLAVLCGMASLSVSLADPSMYGAAPPPKYPAPAAPPTYPAPPKYEAPATTTTTTTPKYETPAKYEEKKEEYPMKMEYKKEEYPMKPEYKKEEYPMKQGYKKEEYPMKQEYKKEEYPPMKMKYGGKKYKRSIEEDAEEPKTQITEDSKETEDPVKITRKVVQTVRDAVIQDLISMIGETVNDDDEDLEELSHFAGLHDGEEEDEEEKANEDDQTSMSPEMENDILDKNYSQSDPMITTPIRNLIKERIRIRICLRFPECAKRLRSWLLQPVTVKPLWSVRPLIKLPIRRRCFWKRVCY